MNQVVPRYKKLYQALDKLSIPMLVEGFLNNRNFTKLHQLNWRKFKLTKYFQKWPCTESFFRYLSEEYRRRGYTSLDFSDVYAWYMESYDTHVIGDGSQLSPQSIEEAKRFRQLYIDQSPEEALSWFCRNYDVSPFHQHLFQPYFV